ncbi:unnamed protein product [Adineta steineri]|uniref:Uncharacterized protein n=1 Tax=Adineta steineri TaxID=433720 RepID=A0A818LKZ2_9BILA|nr:unnamed protein product [Adineta steineri]CAF3573886.1 unnamed protein product [Adineta steineri]
MEQALSTSLEASTRPTTTMTTTATTNNSEYHRCPFNFHPNNMKIDSTTIIRNQEPSRKRQLSESNTCNTIYEMPRTVVDNSCRSPAVPMNKMNETATTPTRPTSLFLTNTTTDRSSTSLRSYLSHPSKSPTIFPSIEDNLSPTLKFTSLPELSSPPAKRLRPQTLLLTPTFPPVIAIPIKPLLPPLSLSISFISPTELADKLKDKTSLTIFDCGSPFRHSEHRIRNSILLRVSDKISRKRLKTNVKQHSTIDNKHLHESQYIILYDDSTNMRRHCTDLLSSDDEQLSAAFKCACEEIQRCFTTNYPPVLVLNSPFNKFFDLYPNLCESLQPRSCPSSPTNHSNESSPPQTAPPIQNSFIHHPTTTTTIMDENTITNHPMTHIIDGLYIGSESNAKNLDELSSEQIRYIVNVTSHVPLYHSEQFQYCHLPADDTQKQNLLEYFDKAYSFIHNAIENNEKVLVHCVAGISRSPAIVIGFLMRYAKMNMNDAYDFVKRKRSIVSPNLNFMGQLLEYEKKLKQDK